MKIIGTIIILFHGAQAHQIQILGVIAMEIQKITQVLLLIMETMKMGDGINQMVGGGKMINHLVIIVRKH